KVRGARVQHEILGSLSLVTGNLLAFHAQHLEGKTPLGIDSIGNDFARWVKGVGRPPPSRELPREDSVTSRQKGQLTAVVLPEWIRPLASA
nr:hypothetical protein [Tanacetum cinerariifolium]